MTETIEGLNIAYLITVAAQVIQQGNFFQWDANPYLITWGEKPILRWYGVLFVTGFVIGFQFLKKIYQREGYEVDDLNVLLWYMIAGTIIGARLVHCLFYEPHIYLQDPISILKFWQGGLASHGGAAGVLLAIYLYQRSRPQGYLWLLDRIVPVAALAGCFIRLGNFFNSEILGVVTNVPWAIRFMRADGLPRHPVQLYESFSYLLIFILLFGLFKMTKVSAKAGFLFGCFMVTVFGSRLFLEMFKVRQTKFASQWDLSMGQWLSVPFIIIGILFIVFAIRRAGTANKPVTDGQSD